MTAAAPVEIEFLELTEFEEPTIPCDVPSLGVEWACDYNPAEWIAFRSIVCRCGIVVRLVCTDCKVIYQDLMAQYASFTCPSCNDETNGFDRFEPLKQSS